MLAERVTEWTKEWKQQGLKEGIEQGREQGKEQGREQGIEQAKLETAQNMLKEGLSVDIISRVTGLPSERIEKIKQDR